MSGFPSAKAAILAAAVIGLMNVVTTLVAIALIDRVGRRFLLLLSLAGMTVALGLVGAGFRWHASGLIVFFEVVAFMVSFNIGLGPVMWLLISEIYPTKIRGKAMSLATLSVWGSNWVVAGTFLSLIHAAGPANTFWIYAGICVLGLLFCYAFIPETKGQSLESIERHWRHFGTKDSAAV
jgi:MFS family permease